MKAQQLGAVMWEEVREYDKAWEWWKKAQKQGLELASIVLQDPIYSHFERIESAREVVYLLLWMRKRKMGDYCILPTDIVTLICKCLMDIVKNQ